MKKSIFPLLLAALMASCANDDMKVDNPGKGNLPSEAANGYVSVKLVAPGDLYGRADGQYQYGTPEENYVNSVRFFFFNAANEASFIRKNPLYDSSATYGDSNPAPLQYFSYYDWTPTSSENQDGQMGQGGSNQTDTGNAGNLEGNTVEKILSSMLVLNIMENQEGQTPNTPAYIVAVVNPTPNVQALVNPSLEQLRSSLTTSSMVYDYLTGLTNKNFVMSSTVYVDGDGARIIAQPIKSNNLCSSQVEAQKQENQLVVYVERVVARVNIAIDETKITPKVLEGGVKIYPTGKAFISSDRDYTIGGSTPGASEPEAQDDEPGVTPSPSDPTDTPEAGVPVYVKFLGWAVTATPVKSNLIKNISTAWGAEEAIFGVTNQPWYVPSYHRSFWAMNPQYLTSGNPADKDNFVWYNFNQLSGVDPDVPQTGHPMTESQDYMQENANPYQADNAVTAAANPTEPTKVIYAAQLVNEQGQPMTIAEWNGLYFTEDGIYNLAVNMLDMYYDKNAGQEGAAPDYEKVTKDDLTFKTRTQFAGNGPIFFNKNYNCYLTLTDQAQQKTWYHKSDTVDADGNYTYTAISSSQLNEYMESAFGTAMVWNKGYTYYYYEIRHLGNPENNTTPGHYGVVRNHIYSANVNKLSGWGTPVWDPTEDIYPEHPDNSGNNISASVEVLMWRLVSNDYSFDW